MKKNISCLLFMLVCVYAQAFVQYPDIPVKNLYTWTGSKSKLWSNPANWQPYGLPGPGNTVVFNSEKDDTCIIDKPVDVYSLVLTEDNPNTTVILQKAAVIARNGVLFGYGIWITDPLYDVSSKSFTVLSGATLFLHGQLEMDGRVFFGGDVYYDMFIAEYYGEAEYKKNLNISESAIIPAFGTAVFSGETEQKINGSLFAANKLIVSKPNKTALVLNGKDRSIFDPPLSVFAAEIDLIDGCVKGPGGLYAADRRFYVHRNFDGLETYVVLAGGFMTATINAPLLTNYKSEIRVEGAEVVFKTDNGSALMRLGAGQGKLIIRNGGLPIFKGIRDLQLDIAQLELEGGERPGRFIAPQGTTWLTGNLINNGEFSGGTGQFIVTGTGYSQLKATGVTVFNHLVIRKDSGATCFIGTGTTLRVKERFIAAAGAITGPGTIEVQGSVKGEAGLKNASVQLMFSGNKTQSVDFNGAPAAWTGKICFRKENADSIILRSPWKLGTGANQSIVFERGILYTGNYFLLDLGPAAQVTGANAKSFVDGPVLKTGNSAFTFPVGAKKIYAPVRISGQKFWDAIDGTATYQVSYQRDNPQTTFSTQYASPINFISSREFWKILRYGEKEATIWLSYSDARSGTGVFKEVVAGGYDTYQRKWTTAGNAKAIDNGLNFTAIFHPIACIAFTLVSATRPVNQRSENLASTPWPTESLAANPPFGPLTSTSSVFPNPARKSSTVTLINKNWGGQSLEIVLIDSRGSIQQRQRVNFNVAGQGTFRLGQNNPGVYYLQVAGVQGGSSKIIVVD